LVNETNKQKWLGMKSTNLALALETWTMKGKIQIIG